MISVTVEIYGHQVHQVLMRLQNALMPTGMMEFLRLHAYPHLQRRAADRFSSQGDDASGSWAPLAPATLEWRTALGYDPFGPINVRSGDLQDLVTGGTAPAFTTHGHGDITMNYLGNMPSGDLMQALEGAQQGGKGSPQQPARPVLAMNERDAEMILTRMVAWLSARVTVGGSGGAV